jgi:two-component SAPR family response regulator
LGDVLPSLEFRSLIADNGYEAMRVLSEEHVDILFTDVVMPGLNGIELAKQAKLMRPGLSIIFMSGYLSRMGEAQALGPLLAKPLRPEQIETAIRNQLAKPH